MIHIYIPLILSALLAYSCRKSSKLCALFTIISSLCIIFIGLVVTLDDETLSKIPLIEFSDSETVTVDSKAMFYMVEGGNSQVSTAFIFTGNQGVDAVAKYLRNSTKPIYIFIKDGDKVLYKNKLGTLNEDCAEDVMNMYLKWKDENVLPSTKIRYKLFIFYMDI